VLSDQDTRSVRARNMMQFFKHESCAMHAISATARPNIGVVDREAEWGRCLWGIPVSHRIGDASICGLGQAAPNPSMASQVLSRTNLA